MVLSPMLTMVDNCVQGNEIDKTFVRKDFAWAMVFVNEVAAAAEAAGQHPNIDIR